MDKTLVSSQYVFCFVLQIYRRRNLGCGMLIGGLFFLNCGSKFLHMSLHFVSSNTDECVPVVLFKKHREHAVFRSNRESKTKERTKRRAIKPGSYAPVSTEVIHKTWECGAWSLADDTFSIGAGTPENASRDFE